MKFLNITDTHITAKTPSSRLDDIQETIKMKFKELGVVIQREGIKAVMHGGDMFHRPEVSNKFVGEIAEIIRSWGVPMYVVIGNHDIQGQNEESLPHTKLGLLVSTGVIKILNRKNPVTFSEDGYTISFEGQEYHPNIDKDPLKDYAVYNQTADFKVLMPHSMMLERDFHEGTVYTLTKDIKSNADLILGAHYHPGFKPHKHNDTLFLSAGSLLRVEASTHSLNTKPKALILDYTKGVFTYSEYELKTAKDGKEVFSTSNLEKRGYNATLENFNNKLRSIKLDDVNIVSMIDEYVKINPEDANIVQKAKDEIIKVQREQVVDNGFVPSSTIVNIDKVEIKNFQVHQSRTVNFVNGLNTIVGESNAGKTAILRAIYWVLYDKPNGNAFITTGKKSCSVKIYLSNGYIIERKRSRSSSGSYILTDPTGKETEYKGFANNVPIDIVNAHQMPEVIIAGKKYRLNVSSQLEGAFMVTASSNDKMAMIGALVDADRADEAKKSVLAEKRNLSVSYKKVQELKESEEAKLERYSHLDKMKLSIDMLEMADSKLDSDEQLLLEYEDIRNTYKSCLSNVNFINKKISSVNIVDTKDIEEYNKLLDSLQNLQDLSTLYKGDAFKLSQINHTLSTIGSSVSDNDIKDYIALLDTVNELVKCKQSYKDNTRLLESININPLMDVELLSSKEINEYNTLLDELSAMIDLKLDYESKSSMSFDYAYDLESLNNFKEKYITLMKEYVELVNCLSESESLNKSIKDIDINYHEIDNRVKELLSQREERLISLGKEIHICETCGSEVSADKIIAKNL